VKHSYQYNNANAKDVNAVIVGLSPGYISGPRNFATVTKILNLSLFSQDGFLASFHLESGNDCDRTDLK
jgi:hypothetical protein